MTRILGALLTFVLLAPAARAAGEGPIDVLGTWYVLIHYRDSATANPEVDRWLDLVWVFEQSGTRLQWTQYPLVVFEDTTGRFEAIAGNPRARVLHAWEPNEAQLETIRGGPRVNARGARTKTLRGSDARGWKTTSRMTATSASVVGYQENLTVEGLDGLPVFLREDVVGNALRASDRGGSRFETEEVRGAGNVLVGRYARDEHRRGRFRMWRTEDVRGLIEKKGTPNERQLEAAKGAYQDALKAGDLP